MDFLDKNGGTEEEKKLLGELNMLTKRTNKEGEEEQGTNNGKRSKFQPTSSQLARLVAAYSANPLPSSEVKKALAEEIGMAEKSVGFWFNNYRVKMKRGQGATLETKEGGKCENETANIEKDTTDIEVEKIENEPSGKSGSANEKETTNIEKEATNIEKETTNMDIATNGSGHSAKFGSENEALELISLLPGVNIKPISDKKEEGLNKDGEGTAKDKEEKIPSKILNPMEMESTSEEDSSTEEPANVGDVDKDSDVSDESEEVDIPKSRKTTENEREKSFEVEENSDEEDNQIEIEHTGDTEENIEHNQSTARKEEVQTTAEELEHNPNETLPEGWKRAGFFFLAVFCHQNQFIT